MKTKSNPLILNKALPIPKKGDKIYVNSSFHVYRGADDFTGGIATISKVEYNDFLPTNHVNYIMVGIEENPRCLYNWSSLYRQQARLKGEFGTQIAHATPDYSPEFNDDNADWQ